MIQIAALRSRPEKQPNDLAAAKRNPTDLGDGTLGKRLDATLSAVSQNQPFRPPAMVLGERVSQSG
jgi:hypothetical protein